jgi:hypothetical protein
MPFVKRIVLDVLKPHYPNSLEFAMAIAELNSGYRVKLTVVEVDAKTETIVVEIEGDNIQFDSIVETIKTMGGSLHSIDEVEVIGTPSHAKAD